MGQIFNRIKDIWKAKDFDDDIHYANRIINDDSDELKKIIDDLNKSQNSKKDNTNNYSNSGSAYKPPQYNNEVNNAFKVLQVSPNSTTEQIKTAYKKLMKEYHPDLVTKENIDIQKEAQQKSQEINSAYNLLKKHLNFN